jgi:hypothetical protein
MVGRVVDIQLSSTVLNDVVVIGLGRMDQIQPGGPLVEVTRPS